MRALIPILFLSNSVWAADVTDNQPLPVSPGIGDVGQMLGSLALVVLAIYFVSSLVKKLRFGRQGDDGNLQVVSALSVGPKDRLVLVRAGEEQVLIGISTAGMQRLHTLKKPVQTTEKPESPKTFSRTLKSVYTKVQKVG